MLEIRSGESESAGSGGTGGASCGKPNGDSAAEESCQPCDGSYRKGKVFVVGIGPGGKLDRTHRAENAIEQCSAVFGYKRYLELTADLLEGKEVVPSGMRHEVERCLAALDRAKAGATVCVLSSGDPGVYGMAGLVLELADDKGYDVAIEIVPGISAANSAAAIVGAPLMLDYACISISDLLVDWETIKDRLEKAASGDMVVALYNPRSKKRVRQLEKVAEIFLKYRSPSTPVAVATAVGTDNENVAYSNLKDFLDLEIGMRSTVIVGNSSSKMVGGRLVTPRGYKL